MYRDRISVYRRKKIQSRETKIQSTYRNRNVVYRDRNTVQLQQRQKYSVPTETDIQRERETTPDTV